MGDYIIITDSTTDMPQSMADELNVRVVPLTFTIDGKDYENFLDGSSLSFKDFYDLIRAGKNSNTSQISSFRFIEAFEEILAGGSDILYLAFSSGLSGTYEQSAAACAEMRVKYPERKIYTVDTLCASMGEALMVYLAVEQKNLGKSIDEVRQFVEDTKLKICHWVAADDLHHLRRGGRVSATAAFMGSMLNIKPIIHVDDNGKLIPVAKARGRKKAIETLFESMVKTVADQSGQVVFISHADCLDDANYLAKLVNDRFKPKKIAINYIGPVIGSHTGTGTLALFFVGTVR